MGKHHAGYDPTETLRELSNDDQMAAFTWRYDSLKVYQLLEQLACPMPCVSVVNETGWHLDCQRRAREAMDMLGIPLPPEDLWMYPNKGRADG